MIQFSLTGGNSAGSSIDTATGKFIAGSLGALPAFNTVLKTDTATSDSATATVKILPSSFGGGSPGLSPVSFVLPYPESGSVSPYTLTSSAPGAVIDSIFVDGVDKTADFSTSVAGKDLTITLDNSLNGLTEADYIDKPGFVNVTLADTSVVSVPFVVLKSPNFSLPNPLVILPSAANIETGKSLSVITSSASNLTFSLIKFPGSTSLFTPSIGVVNGGVYTAGTPSNSFYNYDILKAEDGAERIAYAYYTPFAVQSLISVTPLSVKLQGAGKTAQFTVTGGSPPYFVTSGDLNGGSISPSVLNTSGDSFVFVSGGQSPQNNPFLVTVSDSNGLTQPVVVSIEVDDDGFGGGGGFGDFIEVDDVTLPMTESVSVLETAVPFYDTKMFSPDFDGQRIYFIDSDTVPFSRVPFIIKDIQTASISSPGFEGRVRFYKDVSGTQESLGELKTISGVFSPPSIAPSALNGKFYIELEDEYWQKNYKMLTSPTPQDDDFFTDANVVIPGNGVSNASNLLFLSGSSSVNSVTVSGSFSDLTGVTLELSARVLSGGLDFNLSTDVNSVHFKIEKNLSDIDGALTDINSSLIREITNISSFHLFRIQIKNGAAKIILDSLSEIPLMTVPHAPSSGSFDFSNLPSVVTNASIDFIRYNVDGSFDLNRREINSPFVVRLGHTPVADQIRGVSLFGIYPSSPLGVNGLPNSMTVSIGGVPAFLLDSISGFSKVPGFIPPANDSLIDITLSSPSAISFSLLLKVKNDATQSERIGFENIYIDVPPAVSTQIYPAYDDSVYSDSAMTTLLTPPQAVSEFVVPSMNDSLEIFPVYYTREKTPFSDPSFTLKELTVNVPMDVAGAPQTAFLGFQPSYIIDTVPIESRQILSYDNPAQRPDADTSLASEYRYDIVLRDSKNQRTASDIFLLYDVASFSPPIVGLDRIKNPIGPVFYKSPLIEPSFGFVLDGDTSPPSYSSAPLNGSVGDVISIFGSNFSATVEVFFGSKVNPSDAASQAEIISTTPGKITLTVPVKPGSIQLVPLTIRNSDNILTVVPNAFTYNI